MIGIHRKSLGKKQKENLTGWLLATPVLLGVLVFFAIPFCVSIWYSFTFGVGGVSFVGFSNYQNVFQSQAFQVAASNTFRFLGIGVPLLLCISFGISLLLKKNFAGSNLFRSILLLPLILPVASVVMVIQVFFASSGVINNILLFFGLPVSDWLKSPGAFWILLGLYLWKNCGYQIILMLSGLNMIPKELYQSASMEGAGSFKSLWYITLPFMWPTLFFGFVMGVVQSFKSYREAFLLGGIHPHESIYMLQHFLNNNFDNLNYQRLSVAAILLFCLIFLLVGILFFLQERHEEGLR